MLSPDTQYILIYNTSGKIWLGELVPDGTIQRTLISCVKSKVTRGATLSPFIYRGQLYFVAIDYAVGIFTVIKIEELTSAHVEFDVFTYNNRHHARQQNAPIDGLVGSIVSQHEYVQIVGDMLYVALIGEIIGVNMINRSIGHVIAVETKHIPSFVATPDIVFNSTMYDATCDTMRVSNLRTGRLPAHLNSPHIALWWSRSDSSMYFAYDHDYICKTNMVQANDMPNIDVASIRTVFECTDESTSRSRFISDRFALLGVNDNGAPCCALRVIDVQNGAAYDVPCDIDNGTCLTITADVHFCASRECSAI